MSRVYLIRSTNAARLNANVYKLFRSRTDPKHCEILFVGVFSDSFTAERDLLYMFRNRFLMYGTKHFQGNPNDMIRVINNYTAKILASHKASILKNSVIPETPPVSVSFNELPELPEFPELSEFPEFPELL